MLVVGLQGEAWKSASDELEMVVMRPVQPVVCRQSSSKLRCQNDCPEMSVTSASGMQMQAANFEDCRLEERSDTISLRFPRLLNISFPPISIYVASQNYVLEYHSFLALD